MARTNYKCPKCSKFNGLNNAYCNGLKEHRCKFCGCQVTVKVKGNFHWSPDWMSLAVRRKTNE